MIRSLSEYASKPLIVRVRLLQHPVLNVLGLRGLLQVFDLKNPRVHVERILRRPD
jgi:hypothetical protein